MKLFAALCLIATLGAVYADNYAVLVAGSSGYSNYRHQADICHAYQIMKGNGIPAKNIIVFAYDDIANDPENPFPGKLYNKPTSGKGVDVYKGCKINYSGADVTPENFLAVITGDKSSVPKGLPVLKSGPKDKVFINFSDHGGSGLIAFPSEYLYANDLLDAMATMHTNKMYKELVWYLEACESGSMFVDLPTDVKVYATTASSPDESSWGTYCPPDDVVDGTEVGACLGDLYSVNWMEDTDAADVDTETLQTQFENIKKTTTMSQVTQYGETDFTTEPIGDFEAEEGSSTRSPRVPRVQGLKSYVDSRDIKLHYLMNKYNRFPTVQNYLALKDEQNSREYFDNKFKQLAMAFGAEEEQVSDVLEAVLPITQHACQKATMNKFENSCRRFTDYSLKYTRFIVTICESGLEQEAIHSIIDRTC